MNAVWQDIVEVFCSEQSLRQKYRYFYDALHRVCIEKTEGLPAEYNDFFSRLQAVCRLTNYPLHKVDGFRWRARQVAHHGMEVDEQIVRVCDNRSDAEIVTPEILALDHRPDAFFAVNDDTAIGILYTVKRAGFKVPDDISICGFTNGQRAIACDPMLTTVEQRGHVVGEEAAEILMDKVEGFSPLDKIEKRVVRTRLIIRGTTK
jgi:hypothetical protein